MQIDFESCLKRLTGLKEEENAFPWQVRLFELMKEGNIPPSCNIPTGLGKTMVIPIWLLALAKGSIIPRKLVYVVNRRTIVDQATELVNLINSKIHEASNDNNHALYDVAKALRKMNCLEDDENIIAVSTLRGELADNKEWKKNPTKPCIIIGTVDMIGSKLLFSGYGDSRRTRPLHAGILGCDTIFIHDEAHLTPAFGKLLRSIERFQADHSKIHDELSTMSNIRVIELSATPDVSSDKSISLSEEDQNHPIAEKRLKASKRLIFHEIEKEGNPLQEKIVDLALEKNSGRDRVLIFVRDPKDAHRISEGIRKELIEVEIQKYKDENPNGSIPTNERKKIKEGIDDRISTLTGQIRGFERDRLLEKGGMQPFLGTEMIERTHYFVATSAAEVGMDLHSDHSICDLSTLDSMIQRLGRVNRFGECEGSIIDLVYDKNIQEMRRKWKKVEEEENENFNESFQKEIGRLEKYIMKVNGKISIETKKAESTPSQKKKERILEKIKQLENNKTERYNAMDKKNRMKEKDMIENIVEVKGKFIKKDPIQWSRYRTFEILSKNKDDMSLESVKKILTDADSKEAFSSDVEKMELTDVLLDLWSQTSLRELPARPQPESWLHGIKDEYPNTYIAWRDEVEKIAPLPEMDISNWFKHHPIITKERLHIPTYEITNTGTDNRSKLLKQFDEQRLELPVIIATVNGSFKTSILKEIVDRPGDYPLEYATIIFPSTLGGLDDSGFFDPKKKDKNIDVSSEDLIRISINRYNDLWSFTSFDDDGSMKDMEWKSLKDSLSELEKRYSKRSVFKLQTKRMNEFSEDDEIDEEWFVLLKSNQKKNKSISEYPTVDRHNKDVNQIINQFCISLEIDSKVREALSIAARYHDNGKRNDIWQTAAGHDPSKGKEALAKGNVDWRKLGGYRHEVGSLIDSYGIQEISDSDEKDLILHLISVHHGWGRPHFEEQAFPPGTDHSVMKDTVYQTMMRYSRLQERFGWWKLAYLESLLRQADAIASSEDSDMEEEV